MNIKKLFSLIFFLIFSFTASSGSALAQGQYSQYSNWMLLPHVVTGGGHMLPNMNGYYSQPVYTQAIYSSGYYSQNPCVQQSGNFGSQLGCAIKAGIVGGLATGVQIGTTQAVVNAFTPSPQVALVQNTQQSLPGCTYRGQRYEYAACLQIEKSLQ